jgi:hypothetical protein
MRMTRTALPITSAGRFSPRGPLGIALIFPDPLIEHHVHVWDELLRVPFIVGGQRMHDGFPRLDRTEFATDQPIHNSPNVVV